MDTKSLHSKHPKKVKPSKDKHEVFVLPPDLLKKLGISIGNINASQVTPPDVNNFSSNEISSEENISASTYNPKPSDTSILETASLMKKSVFLSPTFIPPVANVIPGEIESHKKTESFVATDLVEPQTHVFIPDVNDKVTGLNTDSSDILEQCYKEDPNKYNTTLNGEHTCVSNIDEVYQNIPIDGNKKDLDEDNNMSLYENPSRIDNVDGVYIEKILKDSCNVELTATGRDSPYISPNDIDFGNSAPKTSKINIISEEKIPLSKFRELKKSQFSTTKNLTPVTVHTIICTKMNHGNSNSDRQSPNNQNPTAPLKNIEILHSKELKSKEKVNNTNSVPSVTSLQVVEDITSNINENVMEAENKIKDICGNRPLHKESREDRKLSNEIKIIEVPIDCQLNGHDGLSEDKISASLESVNGFDIHGNEVDISGDTSVMTSDNGQTMDDERTYEVAPNKKVIFPKIGHGCNNDYVGKHSDIQDETVIEKNGIIEDGIKQNAEVKYNHQESSSLNKDSRVKNKSSKNEENKTLRHNELASMINATKNVSSSNADVKIDKVKEIAAYLRKFSHIYTDKKKTKTALRNGINKKESIDSNINTIESKLCIQGVEKPGGTNIDSEHTGDCKVLRTYTRHNPKKASKLHTPLLQKTEKGNAIDSQDHTLQAVNNATPNETQKFCLCFDFGHLSYYDSDNLYEHIHFWHHYTTNCEMDIIFSIYNDEPIVKNETLLDQEEKTEENDETYSVCWNSYNREYSDDVDNSDRGTLGPTYNTNVLKDAGSMDTLNVPVLDNVTPKANTPKDNDKAQSNDDFKVDNILETIDDDMTDRQEPNLVANLKDIEKPLSTEGNDSTALATVTGADSDCTNPGKGITHLNSTSTSGPGSPVTTDVLNKATRRDSNIKENDQNEESINANKVSRKSDKMDSPVTVKKNATKRKLSTSALVNSSDEPSLKKNNLLSSEDLASHVDTRLDLRDWRNLDDPDLKNKLKEKLKRVGLLRCSECGMEIKKFNRFVEHVKYCLQNKQKPEKSTRKSRIITDEEITCGVCQKTMQSSNWLEHIGKTHNYLAWIDGQATLNLENESDVWRHLQNIIRLNGKLTCYKCGLNRSRVKLYLAHVKTCDGSGMSLDETSTSVELDYSNIQSDSGNVEESTETAIVKCGVCKNDVANSEWIDHIAKEHKYLAWRDGESPLDLDDEESVSNYLKQIIRQYGGLTCHKCGLVRKRGKLYLTHVETCDGSSQVDNSLANTSMNTTTQSTDDWFEVPIVAEERKVVKCGVCSQEVAILDWIKHIGKEHDYLAWRDDSTPLNLEDELAVKSHLLDVSRQAGGLTCNKCEKIIKYPKTYVQHIKECTGPNVSLDSSKLDTSSSSWIESFSKNTIKDEILTCGVCASKIESAQWIHHIETDHRYLAWVEGETPIDKEDAAMVQKHLYDVSKILGGLVCTNCGLKRKYVKSYLAHVEICEKRDGNGDPMGPFMEQDLVECARCSEKVPPKAFRKHAMKEHYNIAWVVGDNPIDLNNPYAVESYLKEYHHANNKLVCKVCRISRVSYVGFYAHIIVCGKTEEETEMYKSVCDICHNKYLRIYKSQHMTVHREKEYAMERKQLAAREKELKKEEPLELIQTGRRKAAEKAKTVIEKYKNCLQDGTFYCSKCGFSSEIEKELSDHVCVENKWGDDGDSDESVKLENCSEEESEESDIDSNVSDEEQLEREHTPYKKKFSSDTSYSKEASKISRLPYQIKNISNYMKRSTEEFIDTYLTDEELFPQWRRCDIQEVPENDLVNYMPPVEESCKVRFDETKDWMSFKRFESDRVKDTIIMFLGACIQCMSWAPVTSGGTHYLAVVTHRHADTPRIAADVTHSGPGLLHIWDCGNVIVGKPRFALGLVHDYGTVWSIDWCPSGARDADDFVPEPNKMHRLGLLAVACSNGLAYIFAVPYPSSLTEKENPFYKLKPVVELRLASNENRKVYQATAVKWSMQKGHSHVVVGYADGTTAYYDLNGDSPLLRTTDNDMTVFYPYHDERVLNSCIEDVDMYPSGAGTARAGAAVCAGSAGGASASALQSHVAAARVRYPPHWPAALLAGDDCLVNLSVNELEWWGGGRRLGGSRCVAGCAWCGRVAAAAPPLLRLLRLHPCYPEVHKQVIGQIQMIPLGIKRKRQNDELAMIVEPITYSDSVKKYGIEFKQITTKDRSIQQKLSATPRDAYPERYPLSDVAALQFCHTFKLHHKLTVAMHAGLIFIVNV